MWKGAPHLESGFQKGSSIGMERRIATELFYPKIYSSWLEKFLCSWSNILLLSLVKDPSTLHSFSSYVDLFIQSFVSQHLSLGPGPIVLQFGS